jgi:hypothetical protein
MKYQETLNKFHNNTRYQAQFHDHQAMKRAKDWLASRSYDGLHYIENSIFTNDLQVIFELRIHFDRTLKFIRASVQP